jgi:hypothetical protein
MMMMTTTKTTVTKTTVTLATKQQQRQQRSRSTTTTIVRATNDDDARSVSWTRKLGRAIVVGAATLSVTLSAVPTEAARAGLNKAGNTDAYAEMMKQMEADRKKEGGGMSAEDLFKQGGGACGDGYELKVVKVLGASCVCVSDSCKDDTSRQERSEYERSFGKQEAKEDDAPVGESGIKFTFAN